MASYAIPSPTHRGLTEQEVRELSDILDTPPDQYQFSLVEAEFLERTWRDRDKLFSTRQLATLADIRQRVWA